MSVPPTWARVVAAAVGGAILSLLAPPTNLWWAQWFAYLPMLWALHPDTPRANRWLSFLYGTLGVGLLFRWIVHTIVIFSPIPWVAAVGILLLFSSVFGLPYLFLWPMLHPMRQRLGLGWVYALPALQVVLEWLSMKVLLFPYQHGVGQYRVPWTWQLASVTGVYGLTWLLFHVNCVLGECGYRWREGRPMPTRAVAGAAAIVAAVLAFGAWRVRAVDAIVEAAPVLRVAQLQSDRGMEWRMTHSARDAWNEWVNETRKIEPGSVDLVVWPEGASPYDLNQQGQRENLAPKVLGELASRGGFDLLVGGGTRTREPDPQMGEDRVSVFNSVYWFDTQGRNRGHYDKLVPLPFGEYLPMAWAYPWLARQLPIGDFRAGTEAVLFDTPHGRFATPICYEAVLPDVCRLFKDADLLVTVTNDAWFGDTANPTQHAMLAATRSIELGLPMVRVAYTGISFVSEPTGALSFETKPFERVNRVVTVHLAKVPTIYARFGDWFVYVCGLGLAVAAVLSRRPTKEA